MYVFPIQAAKEKSSANLMGLIFVHMPYLLSYFSLEKGTMQYVELNTLPYVPWVTLCTYKTMYFHLFDHLII